MFNLMLRPKIVAAYHDTVGGKVFEVLSKKNCIKCTLECNAFMQMEWRISYKKKRSGSNAKWNGVCENSWHSKLDKYVIVTQVAEVNIVDKCLWQLS